MNRPLTDPARQQDGARVPPLVLFKEGSANPPIFMAHGLGGSAMEVLPLATRLDVSHSIYGMQARGIDGLEQPHERIGDMAEYHLDAIRQVQPHGPYFLIGYSFGGLETLEVARRLSGAGEKIALLALLDSYPHRRNLSVGQNARLALYLAGRRAAALLRSSDHHDRAQTAKPNDETAEQKPSSAELQAGAVRVSKYQVRAWRNYRPQSYNGKIRFVQAAIRSYLPADPVTVWGPLVKESTFESVPCNHQGMLTTHIETVSAIVSRYVKEALGEK